MEYLECPVLCHHLLSAGIPAMGSLGVGERTRSSVHARQILHQLTYICRPCPLIYLNRQLLYSTSICILKLASYFKGEWGGWGGANDFSLREIVHLIF